MFSSLYAGLTGLIGFSKGLDVVSNNVANLNTTGFKSSQLQFQDLFYQYKLAGDDSGNRSSLQIGAGVETSSTSLRFNQGEFRDTGNALDAAIDGSGFFVLRSDEKTYYTRSGRFEIGADDYLVDALTKHKVAAIMDNGALTDIDLTGLKTSPPTPTTAVNFTGSIVKTESQYQIKEFEIFDSLGGTHKLTVTLVKNTDVAGVNSWFVNPEVDGEVLTKGEIRFDNNGEPVANFHTAVFDFGPEGTVPTTITLNFGNPGSRIGVTMYTTGPQTNIEVSEKNGHVAGALSKLSFDGDGNLLLEYSNTDVVNYAQLALAWFDDLQGLQQVGGNLFINDATNRPKLAHANGGVMGTLQPGKVELSNVELTEQFTDMVILQRGYQASSQIISTTNEMIQQLFDMKAQR